MRTGVQEATPLMCILVSYFFKKSFDEVCLELKTLKSEFSKVWGKLQRKVRST